MRKISVVAICLVLVLSLAACKMPQIQLPDHDLDNTGKPNTSVPAGSQAEESSQPDTQEAPASFLETVAGIWIAEDSVSHRRCSPCCRATPCFLCMTQRRAVISSLTRRWWEADLWKVRLLRLSLV